MELNQVDRYLSTAKSTLELIEASVKDETQSFAEAVFEVITILGEVRRNKKQVILIGNGGSAAIASELANRLWKFCSIRTLTFNDPVILTATANDCGWENVFAQPISIHANSDDLLIAISSSGESENILEGVKKARQLGCQIVSLSGFRPTNRLRLLGNMSFYVPSESYRHIERTHLFVLDCIHDLFLERDREIKFFVERNSE